MSRSISCGAFDDAVQLYYIIVSISAAYTILVVLSYTCCLKGRLEGAPGLHAQFYFVAAAVKLTMAIALFAVFIPICPWGCVCPGDPNQWRVYPTASAALSVRWLIKGYFKLRQAAALSTPGDPGRDAESSIYTRTPTSEVEVV